MDDPELQVPGVGGGGGPKMPVVPAVLGFALLVSTVTNVVLWRRANELAARPTATQVVAATTPCPMCPACPEAPAVVCADAGPPQAPCPVAAPAVAGHGSSGVRGPATPPVDEAAAQEGEGHIARATEHGERDPVHREAQRAMVDGVDRVVSSRSPAAAERFLQRNLPAVANMDCAFRDPAMAEHVRMQLRPMNALARPQARLTEEQLLRYERDLRCPRQ
ncbi:MAG: hypothetical protein JNK72_18350 [Myxococcales bacterium]|nr:hypothetical protein [Myxococcales bacterium]